MCVLRLIIAFPMSILQMIAMVYYNERDLLSIGSIMISLISVSSKSFVFSAAAGRTKLLIIYFCRCILNISKCSFKWILAEFVNSCNLSYILVI